MQDRKSFEITDDTFDRYEVHEESGDNRLER